MATKTFKSTKDLMNYVKSKGVEILQEIIDQEVIPELMYQIQETVYNAYDPVVYERRYDDSGLGDVRNVVKVKSQDGLKIKVRNMATSVNDDKYLELDVIIVQGNRYSPNMRKYVALPYPRDFYKATSIALEKNLPYMVKEAFKRKGMNVTVKSMRIKKQ